MKKIIYFLIIFQLLGIVYTQAQNRIVSGKITDSSGHPVIGASVTEKGVASNATATDAAGTFRLQLRGTSNRIQVSAVGYSAKEITIRNADNTVVVLSSDRATDIEEVVVVGFGRQKKITSTGAISSVSGKEIRDNPAASMQNTLAGRLPGFFSQQQSGRPGADGAAFYIRGVSSYNGNNQPLIIVDDIEFTYDQFARLDPNEVESISILKDASTTAVYGVRGANGVVVVTTRRGQIGAPRISFRGETSLGQPTKIPKFLNAYETAVLYNQAQRNDGVAPANVLFKPADLAAYQNGSDPYGHPDNDWKEILFKNFSNQFRGNFDISGGTERVKYFISAGYLNQGGMIRNFSKTNDVNGNFYHQRYNYRSNLDIKVTSTTDLRLDLYGNIGEVNTPSVGSPFGINDVFWEYSSFLSLAPFNYPVYNPNGSYGYSNWQRNNPIGGNSYNQNNIIGRLALYGYNRSFENNMNLVASVNQKLNFITKGLSAKATVSYASSYGYGRSMTRDQFPSFIYNPATSAYEPRDPNIFRVRRLFYGYDPRSTYRSITTQGFLTYDRTFQNRHHVYGLVLLSQNSVTRQQGGAYNFVPNNFRGITTRVGYDFRQKYLIEFNGAYNGSDRFSASNRYGYFPAVSAGWNISEEGFFKNNIKAINRMKLRGSYGIVGNDNIGGFSYLYLQTYNGSGGTNFGQSNTPQGGIAEGALGNPNVTWEKEKKLDLGLELGLFKNKLAVTLDYFNNNRYDILTTRGTVSAVFGQSLPPVNLGKVNNEGYEVEVTYGNNITKNLSYNLKGTYSYAKNKIVFQDEASYQFPYQAFTGNSIGQIRVYSWTGFYDSASIADPKVPKPGGVVRPGDLKYADLNNDGVINGFDMAVQGFPNLPNTTAGFQMAVRYKGFNVGVFFQGSFNFNARGVSEAIRAFASNLTSVHQNSWTPALGDNAQYPLLTFAPGISDPISYPSTFWFIRGDFIRLKTAELGYALPKKLVAPLKMKEIRVYANGYNLFTWTKLSKLYEFDPEIASGTDRVNYPPQRMINFGLTATF